MAMNHLNKFLCLEKEILLAVKAPVCALKRCQVIRKTIIIGNLQEKL